MSVYDRDSWWREWRQTALPVAVTLGLLALGLANVVSRATSAEVEDGVLWVERAVGVVAAEVASPSAASRAGVRPGDMLLAIDNQPVEGRADVLAHAARVARRRSPHLHAAAARLARDRERLAGADAERRRPVLLRARRGRHLHAARRRRGARAAADRSGDAAFLLAVGGVLRPVHVLVQRPARSRRLGLLLGRRDRGDGAAAAVPALRAGVSGASAHARLLGDAGALAAGDLPARRGARLDARARGAALGHRSRIFRARDRAARSPRVRLPRVVLRAPAWRSCCARCRARAR